MRLVVQFSSSGADDFKEVVLGNVVADLPVIKQKYENLASHCTLFLKVVFVPNGRIGSDIFDHLSVEAVVSKEPYVNLQECSHEIFYQISQFPNSNSLTWNWKR